VTRLPVIVGMGGVNAAGRISFDHAYRRLVIDGLDEGPRSETYRALASLMGIRDDPDSAAVREHIKAHTLVRRIENFDVNRVYCQTAATVSPDNGDTLSFRLPKRQLPEQVPAAWTITEIDARTMQVTCRGATDVLFPDTRVSRVSSAGQLPTGFDPGNTYQSRSHPRGLQLAVYAASDALQSTGISLADLKAAVSGDQIAVYSGSAMGQLNEEAYGGLLQNPMRGKRPSSKHCSFGLSEMPGDFVNAYVLGSVGGTAGIIGACATFLYNVRQGIDEIRSGEKRIVFVGNSEAPVEPDVIEGYRTMGALAEDDALAALDGTGICDNRRAVRPFSDNCGFTVAEGASYLVLMDDELAMQLGARILGSAAGVFVNADGYKKSISGPGVGNYLTVAKALALARSIIGEQALRTRTYMQAHGTSTPQNRVTESHILSSLAGQFGIDDWVIGAVKAYVGHTMAPAGGDQLAAVLGQWQYGLIPGITTIDHLAGDVHTAHLRFPFEHVRASRDTYAAAFVNSKGFGGNNATGVFLSPWQTLHMLEKRWGKQALAEWKARSEETEARASAYDTAASSGAALTIYQFGEGVMEGADLRVSESQIGVPGFGKPVSLTPGNPWSDMC
jgi:acetoacetyl-[acyl-carrier protein] synthase